MKQTTGENNETKGRVWGPKSDTKQNNNDLIIDIYIYIYV